MVDAINVSDNSKSGGLKTPQASASNVFQRQMHFVPKDEVVLSNKKNQPQKEQPMNKLQVAALAVSSLASAALIVLVTKTLLPPKEARKLIKLVKNSSMPQGAKDEIIAKLKNDFNSVKEYALMMSGINWSEPVRKPAVIDDVSKALDKFIGMKQAKSKMLDFIKSDNYDIKNGIKRNGPKVVFLNGPSGVGKTSFASATAKAWGKQFFKIECNGQSNASFIKGTEGVYVHSEPGQIMQCIRKAGTSDIIIQLDEIDKMAKGGTNGDPYAALLSVLDSVQAKMFTDNNVKYPFDLSNVTFMVNANEFEKLPKALKDRLHNKIDLPKYSSSEKFEIAKLKRKELSELYNLDNSKIVFDDKALKNAINKTTDEGARATVDIISSIFEKIKCAIEDGATGNIKINKAFIDEILPVVNA